LSYIFDNQRPIYLQLQEFFSQLIVSGSWAPGERVASVRELAMTYGVNPNTMQRALSELERDGLMYTERTSGRFITEDQQLIDRIRRELASEIVEHFLSQMTTLGCSKEELLTLINKKWRVSHVSD
jgi:GntR family transcriptional regulator